MTHTRKRIIRDLRSIRPARPYTDRHEAFAVAKEQAHELLKFLKITGSAVDVGLIIQLPRIVTIQALAPADWRAGDCCLGVGDREALPAGWACRIAYAGPALM